MSILHLIKTKVHVGKGVFLKNPFLFMPAIITRSSLTLRFRKQIVLVLINRPVGISSDEATNFKTMFVLNIHVFYGDAYLCLSEKHRPS